MRALNIIALVLVVVGALNWGLVGLFNFNLVSAIFGEMTALTRVVYVLVGIAGVYTLTLFPAISHQHTHRPLTA